MKLRKIFGILMVCVICAPFYGTVYKAEEESFSFSIPVAYDTYVRKGHGTTDYSGETTMIVDARASSERVGVVKFRYGSGDFESTEAIAQSANQVSLRIRFSQNLGSPDIAVYAVRDEVMKTWEDSAMNYNLATSLGLLAARGDERVPLVAKGDMEGVAASDYMEFDVTDYVKEQAQKVNENGDAEFVFLICGLNAYSSNDYFRVYGDNGKGTTNADNVPRLFVSAGKEGVVKRDAMRIDIQKKYQVVEDFTLPAVIGADRADGEQSEVEWRSDTESVISLEHDNDVYRAYVTRPHSSKHEDAVVTLTATVRNGEFSQHRSFKLYVPPQGVYNSSLTNYVGSNLKTSAPNSVVYAYVNGSNSYKGFVKFNYDSDTFHYTPKAVLRMKPKFMQGAFVLKITALDSQNADECTEDMLWKTSQTIINEEGLDSITIEQDPTKTDWIEWDVTDYINSISTNPLFRFEITSTGTAYCMMYGNREKYIPQLKLYNYEIITDAKSAVENVVRNVKGELELMQDELNAVTGDIALPVPEQYGVFIGWQAFDENGEKSVYISDDGELLKQPDGESVKVLLRASISRNDYEDTKEVVETYATVLPSAKDEEAVEFNTANLELANNILTKEGMFPKGFYGANIEWSTDSPGSLQIEQNRYKVLKRDENKDTAVKISAKITKGEITAQKDFDVYILRANTKNLLYAMQTINGSLEEERTNDDDVLTYYSSETDFSIVYKLLSQKKIGEISIVPYNGEYIDSIGIYASVDGVQWEKLKDVTLKEGINSFDTDCDEAAYLRLDVKTSANAGIREVGVFEGQDAEILISAEQIVNAPDFAGLAGIPLGAVTNDFELKNIVNGAQIEWSVTGGSAIELVKTENGYKASVRSAQKPQGVRLLAVVSINSTIAQREFSVTVSAAQQNVSSSGGGGGGSGQISSKPAPINTPAPTKEPVADKMKFTDLGSVPWAKESIERLYALGIINGKSESEFMPMELVKREEFVKMIVTAAGFELGTECAFCDVDRNGWYYPYICAAVRQGVVSGIDSEHFGLGNKITRQDMAVIIFKAFPRTSIEQTEFADKDEIADYAADAVQTLAGLGVFTGDENGKFNPSAFATRAQAAAVIDRMMNMKR